MSVIQKMLTEVDKRDKKEHGVYVTPNKKQSKLKLVLLAVFLVLFCVVLVGATIKFLPKFLHEEEVNNSESLTQIANSQAEEVKPQEIKAQEVSVNENKNLEVSQVENKVTNEEKANESKNLASTVEEKKVEVLNQENTAINHQETKKNKTEDVKNTNTQENNQDEIVFDESENIEYMDNESSSNEVEPTPIVNNTAPTLSIKKRKLTKEEEIAFERKVVNRAIAVGDKDGAIKSLRSILSKNPADIEAREMLASLYHGTRNDIEAIRVLSRGIELSPNHYDYRLFLARIYVYQNNYARAIDVLMKGNPPVNSNVDYYATLATLTRNVRDYKNAEYAYRKLSTLPGNDGKWYMGLGIVLEQQDKKTEALKAYKNALRLYLSASSKKFVNDRIKLLGSK